MNISLERFRYKDYICYTHAEMGQWTHRQLSYRVVSAFPMKAELGLKYDVDTDITTKYSTNADVSNMYKINTAER